MFSKIKIAARLLFGFGMMMLLIACLGGYSLVSLDNTGDGYESALRSQGNYARDIRILKEIELARAALWKYLATADSENFGKAQGYFKAAQDAFTELTATTLDPQRKVKLQELQKLVTNYKEKTDKFKEIKGRNSNIDNPEAKEIIANANTLMRQIDSGSEDLAKDYEQAAKTKAEAAQAIIANATHLSLLLGTISLVLGFALTFFISRSISVPVKGLTGVMARLADGDHGVDVPGLDRLDEIGSMAHAVQIFKANAIEMERLAEEQRNVKKMAEQEKKQAMRAIADDFERGVRSVVNLVSSAATEMQASAQSLTSTAEQTSHQSMEVAAAVEQTARNVQTVASATEELTASISEISNQMSRASVITHQGAQDGESTNANVKMLAETTQKIGEVIKLIQQIAEQTNLLALNATIEAARAGDAGKGFAVVASEVKTLATQTDKATEDIEHQINTVQTETTSAVGAIAKICSTLAEIKDIATAIAASVEEQSSATKEIARNVQEAAKGTEAVSRNVSGLTQASKETGTSAQQMYEAATDLAKQGETLRREVDKFLVKIRSLEAGAQAAVEIAKSDHINFKNNIADALAGRKKLSAAKLSTHHTCRFGEWYDSVQDEAIKNDPAFKSILEPHKNVHDCGKEVLICLEKGKLAEAAEVFKRLEMASEKVLMYADQLGKNVAEREKTAMQETA